MLPLNRHATLTRETESSDRMLGLFRFYEKQCVVSTKMATALVRFADGSLGVVARRRLRLNAKPIG